MLVGSLSWSLPKWGFPKDVYNKEIEPYLQHFIFFITYEWAQ